MPVNFSQDYNAASSSSPHDYALPKQPVYFAILDAFNQGEFETVLALFDVADYSEFDNDGEYQEVVALVEGIRNDQATNA